MVRQTDCARDAHGHPARESERLTDSRLLFEDHHRVMPCTRTTSTR